MQRHEQIEGIYRRISARNIEQRQILGAERFRIMACTSIHDALRVAIDFGIQVTGHRTVYAVRRNGHAAN